MKKVLFLPIALCTLAYKLSRYYTAIVATVASILLKYFLWRCGNIGAEFYILASAIFGFYMWRQKSLRKHDAKRIKRQKEVNSYYDINKRFKPNKIKPLIYENGIWKMKEDGRVIRFRGVNLPAKLPLNLDPISFVDKPFPLKEAPEHFERLSNFGFNLVRLTVTWEAVMHKGPGIIDFAYMAYLRNLVDVAHNYGIYIIVDPHQDVWSRFTGGDGAPLWTLNVCGFNTNDKYLFHRSGCAVIYDQDTEEKPRMQWPTNYFKLITGTMFTIFFAGDTYAPDQKAERTDQSLQAYLQHNYIEYLRQVAIALKDKDNVIGFGSMNEPNAGFVGQESLHESLAPAPFGIFMSTWQNMRLGAGKSLHAPFFHLPFIFKSYLRLNKEKKMVWKSKDHDIWLKANVYEETKEGDLILKKPNHFSLHGDTFEEKYMAPFYKNLSKVLREVDSRFVLFAEPHLDGDNPFPIMPRGMDTSKYAFAPHFYDFLMLVSKRYFEYFCVDVESTLPVISKWLVHKCFKKTMKHIKEAGRGCHVLIGEIGIPFDMGEETNYESAMNRVLGPVEESDIDYVLWCYCSDNNNETGDNWNGENLSIRSSGHNRAIMSVVRPYPVSMPANIKVDQANFDPFTPEYRLTLTLTENEKKEDNEAFLIQIFFPMCHFQGASNQDVTVSNGSVKYNEDKQLLDWNIVHQTKKSEKLKIHIK